MCVCVCVFFFFFFPCNEVMGVFLCTNQDGFNFRSLTLLALLLLFTKNHHIKHNVTIKKVMLKTKQLDITTAAQRAAIAASHDRNRVLERQEDLSPAALKWISAPLAFKQHLARQGQAAATTNPKAERPLTHEQQGAGSLGGRGTGGSSSASSSNAQSQIEALGGSATAAGLAALNAANIDFSDFEADALESGDDDHSANSGGSGIEGGDREGKGGGSHGLISHPLVLRVVRAWKQQRRRELMAQARQLRQSDGSSIGGSSGGEVQEEEGLDPSSISSSSSSSAISVSAIRAQRQARAASLFSTHKPPCTERELQERGGGKRKAQPSSVSRTCQTPEELKKERDLHGPQHQQKFPDYIHFVHIPKVKSRFLGLSDGFIIKLSRFLYSHMFLF